MPKVLCMFVSGLLMVTLATLLYVNAFEYYGAPLPVVDVLKVFIAVGAVMLVNDFKSFTKPPQELWIILGGAICPIWMFIRPWFRNKGLVKPFFSNEPE